MSKEKNRILIAEDDKDILSLLRLYLEKDGFDVLFAEDGIVAFDMIEQEEPDLIISDIMMPGMNGYDLIQKIRKSRNNVPIIILSAKNQDNDKILGLDIGADDYMTKPFNPLELVAHVKAALRRFYSLGSGETAATSYKVGELEIDIERVRFTKKGEEISLTPFEFKIMTLLMKNPGRVFTKVQIYEYISGEYYETDENALMVHMSKLRDKIEDDRNEPKYIKTIRGLGYKIEKI
ncbi:MAG: response regulator transcription factor [Butyrivibrio sp.]|jgi:DNA-binding response OmpR family regulator|nr:response regulator transcription factor [Butyrivibrio sp.]